MEDRAQEESRKRTALERVLAASRYLTMITVVICIFAALVLYLGCLVAGFKVFIKLAASTPLEPKSVIDAAVGFLKVVDILLIAAGLQIISLGMYKIFVNYDFVAPPGMAVANFSALKVSIVKIASLVLIIAFVEHAVTIGPAEQLLEYGIAIAAVLAAATWGISLEDKR